MLIYSLIVTLFILLFGIVYVLYRLNVYISTLEDKLGKQIRLTENLKQSMKEIMAEDFLQNDGRLKKFMMQKDTGAIINGMKAVEEDYTEI